ncbi:hypothetical protein [Streptomyces sp. SID3343]|uniref:hypothetical protein n=1 Tax=Streptomyces sp. SID3343 TaxID=2690260 RepID=UPI00137193E6|nr:hypothetical protein [Streptomyces sp. SID3343]MYW02112.1 hypothetical protein [Streptomyces sp. SID3343]
MFRVRRSPSKLVAAAGVAAMVGTTGLVAFAPAARAAPVDYSSKCYLAVLQQWLDPADVQMDIQVTPEKPTYAVGDKVSVTWHWVKRSKIPADAIQGVGEDKALPRGEVLLSGAQTGSVPVEGERKNPAAAQGEELQLTDMKGEVTLTRPGSVDLTPGKYTTYVDAGLGDDITTACQPVGLPAVSRTLEVEGQGTEAPTLTASPSEVDAGGLVTLAGDNWSTGGLQPELCAADGTACDPAKISANTLTVADGKLAGNVTVSPIVTDGDYTIRVKASGVEALSGVVRVSAVGMRVHITPDHGPAGTVVTVTGSGYAPLGYAFVTGYDAAGASLDTDYAETAADGTFTKDLTIQDPNTVSVGAYVTDMTINAKSPFRFTVPGRELTQTVTGKITEGGLTIGQQQSGVHLSGVTVDGKAQAATGDINTVTVKDSRIAGEGWSLTGSVGDFTSAEGGRIPADRLTWTPAVKKADEASVGVPTPGSPGPIGTGATLATMANAPAGGTTAGTFAADAGVSLAIPAYQKAGTYTGTLTLSIS